MQSQPRKESGKFDRSSTDPWINTAPRGKPAGARVSRSMGVSPLSSSLGTRVWQRSPDPPVSRIFIVFSPVRLVSAGPTLVPWLAQTGDSRLRTRGVESLQHHGRQSRVAVA